MRLLIGYTLLFLSALPAFASYPPEDSVKVRELQQLITTLPADSADQIIQAHIQLARIYDKYDSNKAFEQLNKASIWLKQVGRNELVPLVKSARGTLHMKSGNLMRALQDFEEGISLDSPDHPREIHTAYLQIDIGNIFYRLRKHQDAIGFYEKALKVLNNLSDSEAELAKAVAINNIGLSYLRMEEAELAIKEFNKALQIRIEHGGGGVITHSYTHILDAYLSSKQIIKADSLLKRLKAEGKADTSSVWYRQLQLQQARLLINQKELAQANSLIQRTEQIGFGSDKYFFEPYLLQVKVELERARGNFNEALLYIDRGFEKTIESRDYQSALKFSQMGRQLKVNQNDLEGALYYADKAIRVRDSADVLSEGLVSELLEMNTAFTKAREQNRALKSTSDDYYARIKGQNWLLFGAVVIIVTLLVLFWYINKLSRRQRENQLNQRELNQRILAVVNNTDSHILSLNHEGVIRLINHSAIEFFKSWIGNDIRAGDNLLEKIKTPAVRRLWNSWFEKSKNQNGWKEVSQIKLKDKTYYYLENFSTIQRANGDFAGLVMVGNDITKEHEFSVEMSKQKDDLEKSNLAKEKMLSILAHDLKDAVYSARSLSEMVKETPDQFEREELLHLFELLYNNFDRTKNLLDGLLDWMRTQTGAMEAKPHSFSLAELAGEIKEECAEKAQNKGVSLEVDVAETVMVRADKEMIRTVMRNLVNNAIKYTQPNEGKVELTTAMLGRKVNVHVRDNGMGISKEDQRKLFQFAGRFTTPGTNNEQGTGFGLSLCNELLKLNNSALMLESKQYKGSDFHFLLPLVNKSEEAPK